jgi:hypothetical protein
MVHPDTTPASGKPEEIKVFICKRESKCGVCGEDLGHGAWITLTREAGAVCLPCADLDELVYLPAGNTALTRRARAHSPLSAVVLKWSRSRQQYERQGLLVQEAALAQAESECLADAEVRERRREREAVRREDLDEQYVAQFAGRIRELYPGCPKGQETGIAEHACLRYSGRVGRSSAAKALDEAAVRLAVHAHIRHCKTNYDRLLGRGLAREDARACVREAIDEIAARWQAAGEAEAEDDVG